MKGWLQRFVRTCHLDFFQDVLPRDIAIYFHELQPPHIHQFRELIGWFHENGYEVVSLDQFLVPAANRKRLFVSFDDNFRNWHRALPVFERLGISCTFYLNSGVFRDEVSAKDLDAFFDRICHSGQRETLTTSELVEIAAAGHTIGCHSHTHPVLSKLRDEEWPAEIDRSRQRLEALVGKPVLDFSIPFGMRRHFSRRLLDHCKGTGFRTVATGLSGLQHINPRDRYALHRTGWQFTRTLEENIEHLRVDARFYAAITGRSALG